MHPSSIAKAATGGLFALSFSLAAPVAAQDSQPQASASEAKNFDATIDQLGHREFKLRKEAEKKLEHAGADVGSQLREAMENHDDAEVRWRARRLVERLVEQPDANGQEDNAPNSPRTFWQLTEREPGNDSGHGGKARLWATEEPGKDGSARLWVRDDSGTGGRARLWTTGKPGQQGGLTWGFVQPNKTNSPFLHVHPGQLGSTKDLESLFEQMFENLEENFDLNVPRESFFDDDFFADLNEQMQASKQGNGQSLSDAQSFTMQSGPGGVHVEVERNVDGEMTTETFEAQSIEELQEQHPELFKSQGGPFATGIPGFLQGQGSQPAKLRRTLTFPGGGSQSFTFPKTSAPRTVWRIGGESHDAIPAPKRRLGVQVSGVEPSVAQFLELDSDVGLRVEGVDAGTLAETLGLQAGDLLLQIQGQDIHGVATIAETLGGLEAGVDVSIQVNRKGKTHTLSAAKPGGADEEIHEIVETKNGNVLKARLKKRTPRKLKLRK